MTYFKEILSVKKTVNGKEITIKTGEFAHQAHGAVTVSMGETVVLATATMGEAREGTDFFPMMVDYEEKFYASGKINSSRFIKREGRPSDTAILTCRLIDRPLRPLFPKGMINDVQIICTVLSTDLENDPAILALIAASAALSISGMPFQGPVGAVRVGLDSNDNLLINPTNEEETTSKLDLVVAGTENAITMVEAGAQEVSRELILKGLQTAHEVIKEICSLQQELIALCKPEPKTYETASKNEEQYEKVTSAINNDLLHKVQGKTKTEFKQNLKAVEDDVISKFIEEIENSSISKRFIKEVVLDAAEQLMRKNILEKGVRIDGRKLDEIRPIKCDISVLPRPHGTGLFQRGETQILSIVTLGSPNSAQIIDNMEENTTKSYLHHYNFPPYSVGEVRPLRGTGRREIGHGFLAERALEVVIPPKEQFPYTIRVVSETFACNGSSSMGSVCGSTLALMDAGVPIKAPVSGIAMGLVTDTEGNYKILTDIQGLEDFAGDMDLKVAGTKNGITALQMDIKLTGLSMNILQEALTAGDTGRLAILDDMLKVIAAPKPQLSKHAPLIETIKIDPDFIRDVIGKGGETIQKITAETGTEISIEQDGTIVITAANKEAFEQAQKIILEITFTPSAGEIYEGVVKRVEDYGAFVEISPGKAGLLHVSKIAPFRVDKVSDLLKEGQTITVTVTEIDNQGRINLSHKEHYKETK